MSTDSAPLVAMPMHHFSSDLHNLFVMKQPPDAYFGAIQKGAEWLLRQPNHPPTILPLVIHPWITGVPHRYRQFRQLLNDLVRLKGLVDLAAGTAAAEYAKASQNSNPAQLLCGIGEGLLVSS